MIAGLLALCSLLAPACGADPAAVAREAEALCRRSDHLWYQVAGTSPGGHALPLVVATDQPERVDQQLRVLVLAGQHGDELTPAQAALLWLRQEGLQPGRFRQVAVLLMPLVNPDGYAAGTRLNRRGADLNRDWEAQSQVETQTVMTVYRRWLPHVVVDVHGFTGVVNGRRVEQDWLEWFTLGQPGSAVQDDVAGQLGRHVCARQRADGEALRAVVTHLGRHTTSLAHRYFAAHHAVPAFLMETGDDRPDPSARELVLLLAELDRRAPVLRPLLEQGRPLAGWQPPHLALPTAPTPARPPESPAAPVHVPVPARLVFGMYLLIVGAGAKFGDRSDDY